MTLRQACLERNAEWVAGWIAGRQMFSIPVEQVQLWLALMHYRASSDLDDWRKWLNIHNWSDGMFDLWLRKRITEAKLYPALASPPSVDGFFVELHVGFLYLEETEEMLRRLAEGPKAKTGAPQLATPGIERTHRTLEGIDATARRVAPTDGPTKCDTL